MSLTSNHRPLSKKEVRAEMERILGSTHFRKSGRLGRFLRFTVGLVLEGRGEELKEYLIGTEVYDRKPPYTPLSDSIVRTEARRLRSKLKEYYESEGKGDSVFIYFPPGSYVPVFHKQENGLPSESMTAVSSDLLVDGAGVSVAVLPFVDVSGTPLSAVSAKGLTEELIHALTQADGIRVVSRAAVAHLGTDAVDVRAMAKQLSLHGVIEGAVTQEHNRLRITVTNSSAEGFQFTSHRFTTETDPETLPQVLEQVATAFISRARPEQSQIRRSKASAGGLTLSVYPHVLQAESLLDEGSALDIQAALLKFEDAARIAPHFARSHCGISMCHVELALRGMKPSVQLVARAKTNATHALKLDPGMIESHACMGCAEALEWDWDAALASFRTAMNLGIHASTCRQYGLVLTALRRFDEASHYLEVAQRIDPFSQRQKIARAKYLYLTRNHRQGTAIAMRPPIYGPLPNEARFHVALMHAYEREHDAAVVIAQQLRREAGAQVPLMAGLAELFALAGRSDCAEEIVEDLALFDPDSEISSYRQAGIALAFDQPARALALLEKSVDDREAELVWLGVDPRFDVLRTSPSFHDLVVRVFPCSKTRTRFSSIHASDLANV